MFLATCGITLLGLVSVINSAPLVCEELVRPLRQLNLQRLEGRWAMVAGSLSYLPNLERFKQRDSATIDVFSNTSDTSVSYTRSMRLDNKCQYITYNISMDGSSFTYDGTDKNNVSSNFVQTSCHDCLVMLINLTSRNQKHLYLFSRRRQLEPSEMEVFRAQVKCLNMPPPVVLDPTKELCPEQTAIDPSPQPEEKTEGQKN